MEFQFSMNKSVGAKDPRDTSKPTRLVILAEFSGDAECSTTLRRVDIDNFEARLSQLSPSLKWSTDDETLLHEFTARSLDDFHPDALVDDLCWIELANGSKSSSAQQPSAVAATESAPQKPESSDDTLDRLFGTQRSERTNDGSITNNRAASVVDQFIKNALSGNANTLTKTGTSANKDQHAAEKTQQLRQLLSDRKFTSLEQLWRGLDFLLREVVTGERVVVDIVDVNWTLLKNESKAGVSDSGSLILDLLEKSAHTCGETILFGCHDCNDDDVELVEYLSQIARASGTVFISASQYSEIHWRSKLSAAAAEHCGLLYPQVLLRLPYGRSYEPIDAFDFEELQNGLETPPAGNPVWPAAVMIGQALDNGARLDEIRGGLEIDSLPAYSCRLPNGDVHWQPACTETLTDRDADRLDSAGINSLIASRSDARVRLPTLLSVAGHALTV